jgi:cold shock CspA family protein
VFISEIHSYLDRINDRFLKNISPYFGSVLILKGKIKKYLSYRGFGFIEIEDSDDDIFFHISNYPRTALPATGQDVEFELIETPKGQEAQNIQIIEKTSEIFDQEEEEETPEETVEEAEEEPMPEEEEEVDDLDELDGVGPTYQKLLRAAGIKSKAKLVSMEAETVYEKLNKANEEHEITKRPPTLANVEAWINLAQG